MKILKTYQDEGLNYIETKYKNGYPTFLLKHSMFFNSIYMRAFVPVRIEHTSYQTNKEIL